MLSPSKARSRVNLGALRNDVTGDLTSIGPYTLTKILGKGSNAVVKLGTHSTTGEQVAVKLIDKSMIQKTPARIKRLEREVEVLQMINHPHVTKLIEFVETDEFYVLVMEYVPGQDLYHYLRSSDMSTGGLAHEQAFMLFYQILSGLEYCHMCRVTHRDIKPENILINEAQTVVKLTDFGMANVQIREGQLMETSCGSPHYAAPEVIRGEKYNGKSSDVWSLGVVLFAMCSGRLPFLHNSIPMLLELVVKGSYEMPRHFDKDLRDLISKMLHPNARERITLKQVKSHPWWANRCFELGLDPLGVRVALLPSLSRHTTNGTASTVGPLTSTATMGETSFFSDPSDSQNESALEYSLPGADSKKMASCLSDSDGYESCEPSVNARSLSPVRPSFRSVTSIKNQPTTPTSAPPQTPTKKSSFLASILGRSNNDVSEVESRRYAETSRDRTDGSPKAPPPSPPRNLTSLSMSAAPSSPKSRFSLFESLRNKLSRGNKNGFSA